ncbi:ABC transporter ATP-binding protein [Actinocorallia sp. B10E7]|uniref:ABC transporter ATP-binding protein n=1 Tax=Actinocorallia sp. B10E7 TaxID=3153558 RepID=UPI00325D62E8
MGEQKVAVRLSGVRKSFGAVDAVTGVDLEIHDGEFFSMLGPSGSGKTTVLRMIAGFEQVTEGTIELAGRDVTVLPPFERDVNTVFQDYALFPHMTVQQNVEYGLMVAKVGKKERRERAEKALASVRLEGFGKRRPSELSGGQRQRVALARALVNEPKVLLLDEPLGALDLKLREQMQVELKAIQRRAGITFLFVTHDQEEALTMSDRVAVFNAGRIEQVGAPADVYERPATEFVANFVGTSNRIGDAHVRPEKLHLETDLDVTPRDGDRSVLGTVAEVVYAGAVTRFVVDLEDGARVIAVQQNLQTSSTSVTRLRGAPVRLSWRPDHEFSAS